MGIAQAVASLRMSMEPGSGLLPENKAKFEMIKKYIGASFSVSGFFSRAEVDYEKSLNHLHQSYLHFFEQEGLKIDDAEDWSDEVEEQSLESVLEGVKKRVDILRKCQRPLFQAIPKFYDLQLKEMLDHATKVIHKNLDAQICAVFLIDKHGRLGRQSLYGVTHRKQVNDSKWFPEETYAIENQNFVGKTAMPSYSTIPLANERRFGEIFYTNTIEHDMTEADNIDRYIQEFGPLYEVMTVPINNRNRTLGVLRIINKVDRRTQKVLRKSSYNERDFFYLSLFASEIGYALLNLERDSNRRLFSSLLKEITRPEHYPRQTSQSGNIRELLDNTLSFLVNNEALPFNFAIIRFYCKDQDSYNTASLAASQRELSTESRDNTPIPAKRNTFVSITCTSREHIVISDISPKLKQFHNRDWIQQHHFTTFSCFPLACRSMKQEKAYGTLSLYTGYKYTYDSTMIELLQTLSDTIATYLYIESTNNHLNNIDELLISVCDLFKTRA